MPNQRTYELYPWPLDPSLPWRCAYSEYNNAGLHIAGKVVAFESSSVLELQRMVEADASGWDFEPWAEGSQGEWTTSAIRD